VEGRVEAWRPTLDVRIRGRAVAAWLDITAKEARWIVGWTIVVLALTLVLHPLSWWFGPADLVHYGSFWFPADFGQYMAAMREGHRSPDWTVYNPYTSEDHAPILMYAPYVALGKVAALVGAAPLDLYYGVEIVARSALVPSIYLFMAAFLADPRQRRAGFILSMFSVGLGFWLGLFSTPLKALGLDVQLDQQANAYLELNTFGAFLAAPHITVGLAQTLLAAVLWVGALDRFRRWRVAAALLALDVGLLTIVHPFNAPVLTAVLCIASLAVGLKVRHLRWRAALLAVGVATSAAPLSLYYVYTFTLEPVWSWTYGRQNTMASPPIEWVAPNFGVVAFLAPVGLLLWRRRSAAASALLVVWIVVGIAAMYLPVPYQRRLGFGLQPALSCLAGVALVMAFNRLKTVSIACAGRRSWRVARLLLPRLALYPFALLAFGTTLFFYVGIVHTLATNDAIPIYQLTRAEAQAGAWLDEHAGPDAVVLTHPDTGTGFPNVFGGRVFVGHIVATYRYPEKVGLVRAFFDESSPDVDRRALLDAYGIDYVFHGPRERGLGHFDPSNVPYLRRVYEQDGVAVYEVVR